MQGFDEEAFHYLCETDVKNFPQQGKKIEIDILAISDGKLMVISAKSEQVLARRVSTQREK